MQEKVKILVVDDEPNSTKMLKKMLVKKGYTVDEENSSLKAAELIKNNSYHIIISDLQMPDLSGMDLLNLKQRETLFIMITGYGSIASAVDSMKNGAYDYINKPFNMDEFLLKVEKAAEKINLTNKINELKGILEEEFSFSNIIGKSKAMNNVFDRIKKYSNVNVNVLIEGESGTGKELVAKAIHMNSDRSSQPFVAINCSAIPENLLESELFGHVKGAFTGATESQRGVFEQANGGTLFLDEIAEMPYPLQAKLLRVLENWEVKSLGSDRVKKVNIRLISATNQNIQDFITKKQFREDLFYRIATVTIKLPPLRERREDIPLLVNHYLSILSNKFDKKLNISPEALNVLMDNQWKGNVRELENELEQASLTTSTDTIVIKDLLNLNKNHNNHNNIQHSLNETENMSLNDLERKYIIKVMEIAKGNKVKASQILGIDRKTLYKKIADYNIET
jgi:DNA-binding NtrC family response regulator